MGNFVYGTRLTYAEWLQTDRLRSIELAVPRQTREIIASVEDFSRENIQLHGEIQEGFDRVCYALADVSASIDELTATFHWGFSEILNTLGHLSDSLDELIRIARTPAQTWAYEQYEIARDAIRRRLWPEALKALDRAINGYGAQPGYALDFRFHHARGMIYLGNFQNADPAIIDLPKAEESFLAAGRYADVDYTKDAARCYLAAGWAAYCQGKMQVALDHTKRAIALHPKLPEAQFQSAKIHMHLHEPDAGLSALRSAIEQDRLYALKAGGDEDFNKHDERLNDFMFALTEEAKRQAAVAIAAVEQEVKRCDELQADAQHVHTKLAEAQRLFAVGTFFGFLDSNKLARETYPLATHITKTRLQEIEETKLKRSRLADLMGFRIASALVFLIIAGFGIALNDGCFAVLLGVVGATGLGASVVTILAGDNEERVGFYGSVGGALTLIIFFCSLDVSVRSSTSALVLAILFGGAVGGFLGSMIGQAQFSLAKKLLN